MDYLHIDNLFFRAKHGVSAKERRVEQEFAVSVRLGVDASKAGKTDKLEDAVDYQEVKNIIASVIEGSSRYLVEKLAEEIAVQVLKDKRVKTIEITVRKPEVWDNGVPGVTIFRTNIK